MQIGLQSLDLLLQDREIQFGPIEVGAFPQPRRRVAFDWLHDERELGSILNGREAIGLCDAARMLGGRINSLRVRLLA